MNDSAGELTQALRRWSHGDECARDEIVERVYDELKAIARVRLGMERVDHTLQPTALVHEAWLKLVRGEQVDWQDRAHFIAVSARVMRQILVDSGRRKRAAKRDEEQSPTLFVPTVQSADERVDILDLDDALLRLEALDESQARLVELRYFGGLTIPEAAAAMGISVATANRSWRAARTWLYMTLAAERPA
jgi:RNA polymerase sigma factor (TIGR02999 family)